MPYAKHDGAGVIIERATGTNLDWLGPWAAIPGISGSPTLPGGAPATYDATTHDEAAATGFKQKRAGLADVNDITFTLFWDPDDTTHQAILTDMAARTTRQYRIRMYGVTRRYGVEGQIGVGSLTANIDGGLTATATVAAAKVNFQVT
jgi:hypothetical protein